MPSLEENLARYEKLIPHLHHTQMALWESVNEDFMRAGCRAMAVATGAYFMPREQDSIATMLNYCVFNVFFPDHRNLVDVHIGKTRPTDDDHRAVLEAHRRSWFSVFEVLEPLPRVGARLRDLFTEETLLVVYPRLAETMHPGVALPVRVMPLPDFHVLFNGPIPCNKPASIQRYQQSLFNAYAQFGVRKGQPLTAEQRGKIETFQTIDVLKHRYPELDPVHARKTEAAGPGPAPGRGPVPGTMNVGRNDPCPCGSGKKFKQCCLHRN
jgi:hypothetical protein